MGSHVQQLSRERFVRRVLSEDLGRGDLYARVGLSRPMSGYVVAKSDGIFAGRAYLELLSDLCAVGMQWHIEDGEAYASGTILLELEGDAADLLAVERTLLNIALHAGGIATMTRRFVDKIAPYGCRLLDTRKTRPLLREFEKYAVRCGGGSNHRMGLDDCLMLKDTHLAAVEDLESFLAEARRKIPFTAKIEIECGDLAMVRRAMEAGVEIVMCDNMEPDEIARAVRLRDERFPGVLLEASGNVTLENIERIAETGVDAISTGSIVHQAVWPDLSMRMR